ncbi:MAG: hypothetical protein ACK56F_00385, partial [bacterium]
ALGTPLDTEAQQPYLDRIQEAKVDVKNTRTACLPWGEKISEEPKLPGASSDAPPSTDEDKKGSEEENKLVEAHAPAKPAAESATQKQPYKDLPVWEGKDLTIVFGAQMVPDLGFQEAHM